MLLVFKGVSARRRQLAAQGQSSKAHRRNEDDTPRTSVDALRTSPLPEPAQVVVPKVAQQEEVVLEVVDLEAAPSLPTPSGVIPLTAHLALPKESYDDQLLGT